MPRSVIWQAAVRVLAASDLGESVVVKFGEMFMPGA